MKECSRSVPLALRLHNQTRSSSSFIKYISDFNSLKILTSCGVAYCRKALFVFFFLQDAWYNINMDQSLVLIFLILMGRGEVDWEEDVCWWFTKQHKMKGNL